MSSSGMTGQRLAGLYQLGALLAHGARGVVYDGRNAFSGERLAVKLFHRELVSEKALARCRRDAEMVAALHHPGVVRVLEWSRRDQLPLAYLVLEFIEGENLQSHVRRLGRLPAPQVLELGLRIGHVLQAAHKLGVLHRGLTPRNVLLAAAAPAERVKVLDFGVAHLPPLLAAVPCVLPYTAPEIVFGEEADARSDQYSLAAVLYEALSGRPPPLVDEVEVEGAAPPDLEVLCPEAPPHMVRTLERALSTMRSDRFPSIADFTRALDDRRASAWHSSASERSARSARSALSPSLREAVSALSARASADSRASRASRGSASSTAPGGPPSARAAAPSQRSAESGRGPRASTASAARLSSTNSLAPVAIGSAAGPRRHGPRRLLGSLLGLSLAGAGAFCLGGLTHTGTDLGQTASEPPPVIRGAASPVPPPPLHSGDPDDLLTEADEALARGDTTRALELARAALPAPRAWRTIALAACRARDARLFEEALAQLNESDRAEAQAGCRRL